MDTFILSKLMMISACLVCLGGLGFAYGWEKKTKLEELRIAKSRELYNIEIQKLQDLRGVEMRNVGQELIDKYDEDSQVNIAIEQLAHLIESVMKFRRKPKHSTIIEICNRYWEAKLSMAQLFLILFHKVGARDTLEKTYENKYHEWKKR